MQQTTRVLDGPGYLGHINSADTDGDMVHVTRLAHRPNTFRGNSEAAEAVRHATEGAALAVTVAGVLGKLGLREA